MSTTTVSIASQAIPAPASESAAIIHMIERAARDPSVDIDKMTQLLSLRTKMEERQAEREWHDAMARAQAAMRPVAADSNNPQTRSKYASYHALDRHLRPIYSEHGFSLNFNTVPSSATDRVTVVCDVARGGHVRRYEIDMPADGKGAKGNDVMTKTHATGSAITYGRRYLLLMIFNISIGESDDDGNAAGAAPAEFLTADQVIALRKELTTTGGNEERFCKFAQVERLEDIYSNRFDAAIGAIRAAAEQRKRAHK